MTHQPALPRRRAPRRVRRFLAAEAAGGVVLVAAALAALVWANSPWQESYTTVWHTELTIGLGGWTSTENLQHWINEALMAVFFLVVGLEIKRELVQGELRDPRLAAVPVIAAVGGMVVPALIYVSFNAGRPGSEGWGVPMATDIAFAVGLLALLGRRVPASLKLFLLTLAVVDDIGAIVVIAAFYSGDLDVVAAALVALLLLVIVALLRAQVFWLPLHVALAAGAWLATDASGVHPTVVGVVLGLLTPARQLAPASESPAERFEHVLHPWTSVGIVPLFALANAGVTISADAFDGAGAFPVAAGIVGGLVVGKALGITAATWLAIRTGIGRLPEDVSWPGVAGVATIAGVGFTVSLFVAGLSFGAGSPLDDAAKIGILTASGLAAAAGAAILFRLKPTDEVRD